MSIWIKKLDLICYVAYTFLKVMFTYSWYFDSGCSRHMTDERNFLKVYQNVVEGQVSFRDGAKRRVLREETLNIDGLSRLKSVLHV